MKILNKLGAGINYIAIEYENGKVERIDYKEAEELYKKLGDALYEKPLLLVDTEEGYIFEKENENENK